MTDGLLRRASADARYEPGLEGLVDDLSDPALAVDSLLVVREDEVICEHWWDGYLPSAPHAMYSVTKTLTATAVGIAIDEGRMGLDDPIRGYLGPAGASIDAATTIRHLLTMSSGRAAGELRLGPLTSEQAVEAFAGLPQRTAVGAEFAYCSLSSHLLGLAVSSAVGMTLLEFLELRVFAPLRIATPAWETDRTGNQLGGTGLFLTTNDLAKVGALLRDGGVFGGYRLFSEEWHTVATSTQIGTAAPGETRQEWMQGYGFQLWRGLHDVFRADGMLGQFCVVAPSRRLVVVTTARSSHTDRILAAIADRLLASPARGIRAAVSGIE